MSEYIEKEVGIVSPVPVGAWTNATAYKILNIVNNGGNTYIAKLANQGIEPGVASNWSTYWMLLAERGVGIQSTSIDEETGNLIITYTDGEVVDAGNVVPVEEFADLKHEMEQAISDAETATGSANDAATLAETKAGLADGAATLATEKAGLADDAATLANQKAQLASDAAELADTKAQLADQKATLAQEAAEDAQAKAILAEDAATNANQAAEEARSIAPSKLDKQSYESTRKQAYTKDKDGQQSMTDLDTGSNAATIPVRDENGTFHVGTPSQSTHPATKGYVDTQDALNEKVANKVTIIDDNSTDTQYPSAKAVNNKIKALPVPMQYKGTLGVGGTIQALPEAAEDNNGFEYKVIADGTYAGQTAKVGDVFISNGTSWDLIPSGDEPSGTVTNVNIEGDGGIETEGSPITTSGTIKIKNTGVRGVSTGVTNGTIKVNTNGADAEVPVAGLQSGAFIDASTKLDKVSVPTEADQVYAKDADGTQKMINVPDITAEVEAEIEDIENGSIEVSQAKSARAINPLTEESGTTQENPFISQGTGTNNNTESVDTTPVARQLEKQGNTIVKNQLVPNAIMHTTFTLSEDKESAGWGNSIGFVSEAVNRIGHRVLAYIKTTNPLKASIHWGNDSNRFVSSNYSSPSANQYGCYILTAGDIGNNGVLYWRYYAGATAGTYEADIYLVDITTYPASIITDLTSHPEHFSWYYNGSLAYDAGTLKNASGRYLVCTHRNLINPANMVSGYIQDDGTTISSSGACHTDDFIVIVPNRMMQLRYVGTSGLKNFFYDRNKNLISFLWFSNTTFSVPANAVYYKVSTDYSYGTTYKNDVNLSLYYTPEQGGEGYDQYYPYVAPKTYDTGSEVLKAFDKKLPSGMIERNTGEEADLAQSGFTYVIGYVKANLGAKSSDTLAFKAITTVPLDIIPFNVFTTNPYPEGISASNGEVYIRKQGLTSTEAYNTFLSGKSLQYELAEPTTEQGTPFDANIDIDDYGMMYWLDSNNELVSIPQGVKIQYPPAYVETLDTLVTYTNGDVTSLALKGALASGDPQTMKALLDYLESKKLDKVTTANKVYGTDGSGNQTTYDLANLTTDLDYVMED